MGEWVPGTRTSNDGLVRDCRVVSVSELPSILPHESLGVTPEQRRVELQHRRDQWCLRLAEGFS